MQGTGKEAASKKVQETCHQVLEDCVTTRGNQLVAATLAGMEQAEKGKHSDETLVDVAHWEDEDDHNEGVEFCNSRG